MPPSGVSEDSYSVLIYIINKINLKKKKAVVKYKKSWRWGGAWRGGSAVKSIGCSSRGP